MSSEFEDDLSNIRRDLGASREELLAVLRALSDGDLDAQRRGGWPVRRILEHVIQSEHIYSQLIANLRGAQPSQEPLPIAPDTASVRDQQQEEVARQALSNRSMASRSAFYTIGKIGHEEYSVLSVLENEANHEREHAAQIKSILS